MLAYVKTTRRFKMGHTSHINAKATLASGDPFVFSVRHRWDHSMSIDENHKQAVFAVLAKAGLIRSDYTLQGFRSDYFDAHWAALPTSL
jgi:hypothetical protein